MFHTVVIPIAHREVADRAVAHGAALARQAGAEVVLLNAMPAYVDPAAVRKHLMNVADAHDLGAKLRLLEHAEPAAAIAAVGSEPGNLLCMATHARGPAAELALGSVSADVVRCCTRPVLLVGPHCGPAPTAYKSLIVALDGSQLAEAILPVVTRWCEHLDVTPWLYQVLSARVPFERGDGDFQESAYVHRLADQLSLDGIEAGWDTVHDRHPAAAIAGFAGIHEPAIVALSTHGRTGLSQVVMGSVAMAVAHAATGPVLVRHPHGGT
jgi:nucleotide-binding universal stress UspA family protein